MNYCYCVAATSRNFRAL